MRQRPGLNARTASDGPAPSGQGLKFKEIGRSRSSPLGDGAHNAVTGLTIRTAKPLAWTPGPGRLTLAEREEISLGLRRGDTFSCHRRRARNGRSHGVPGGGRQRRRDGYRAWQATDRARQRSPRPKTPKLATPAGRTGHPMAEEVVVPRGDRSAVAARVPRRSDDVGEPRDDLPVAVCPGPR